MKSVQLRYLPAAVDEIACARMVNRFFYYGVHVAAAGNVKSVIWNDLSECIHILYFV